MKDSTLEHEATPQYDAGSVSSARIKRPWTTPVCFVLVRPGDAEFVLAGCKTQYSVATSREHTNKGRCSFWYDTCWNCDQQPQS
jgi:hypothetical protein